MFFRIPSSICIGVAAAATCLLGLTPSVAAQTPCPIASDTIVSQAVGMAVAGSVDVAAGSLTTCTFSNGSSSDTAFGVSKQAGAFGPSEGGAAALAERYIPGLPDVARTQIEALSQAGMNVAVPDYQFESVAGIGDSALWVQTQLIPGFFKDSLLVQSGGDAFAFDVDDSPDARASLTALAQAVLAGS